MSVRQMHNRIELTGSRYKSLDLARGRLVLVGCLFLILYTILSLRLVDLAVFKIVTGEFVVAENASVSSPEISILRSKIQDKSVQRANKTYSKSQMYDVRSSKYKLGWRPDIMDREGVLLARSLHMKSLYADPAQIQDPYGTSEKLAALLGASDDRSDILKKLLSQRRFVWIKRHLSPREIEGALRIGDPGLMFKSEYKRVYPQGHLASHLLGYASVDGHGLSGLEKGLDKVFLKDESAVNLSIDVRIQYALRSALLKAITKHQAIGGAGLVMDVKTGDILAAVSLPDFDPHTPGEFKSHQLFNRFSLGVYELGSIFKIFSTAAYFETQNAHIGTLFDVRKPIKKFGHRIRDFHGKETVLTLPEVFIHSSNIGSAQMGEAIGDRALQKFFSDLGLFDLVHVPLPEKALPLVPSPWRPITTMTASYGHGIAVTPMHFMVAACSVINGGQLIAPHIVKRESENIGASSNHHGMGYRVVSPSTSDHMQKLLRLVVSHGTGSMAEVEGYGVGGKTGTAEKSRKGGYDTRKVLASFFGAFPMNDPRYAVFVMVDEPKGIPQTFGYATGGWVAAPVVQAVINQMIRIKAIPKNAIDDPSFLGKLFDTVRTNKDFENKDLSLDPFIPPQPDLIPSQAISPKPIYKQTENIISPDKTFNSLEKTNSKEPQLAAY